MIDLDEIEKSAVEGQTFIYDWYDGGGAPEPDEALALVRVVRAALRLRFDDDVLAYTSSYHEAYADFTASLVPFRDQA